MKGVNPGFGLLVFSCIFLGACEQADNRLPGSLTLSASGEIYAGGGDGRLVRVGYVLESAADKLLASSDAAFYGARELNDVDFGNCDAENTAVVTVYSTNSRAQNEIELTLDGVSLGVVSTYFSDSLPDCKAPDSAGVKTRLLSAGDHTLEATSPNLHWPRYAFTVAKCACMTIQLP